MDASSSQICRLCLEGSVDPVNIWQTFKDSTIATILAKHFWFQPQKDDNLSEWLCQSCWNYTETFHHFYARIEMVQNGYEQKHYRRSNDWFVVVGNVDGVIKAEPSTDVDLNSVKIEEPSEPQSTQTIDIKHASSSSDDGTDNSDVADSILSTDDEDDDDNELSNDTTRENNKAKRKSRSSQARKEKVAKQDEQIREIFSMKCTICKADDVTFATWTEARVHYRKVHKTSGYLMCCDKKFSSRYAILEHVLRHVNPKAYQCSQCDQICSNKFSLKSHIDAAHEPTDTRPHKCSLCPKSFVKAGVLKVHMLNRHPQNDEEFPCDKCGKSYRSLIRLKSHVRLMHNTKPHHICEICAQQCRTKGALKRHILNQHSTTPHPKIQCTICSAWLTQSCLKRHMQSMHDEAYQAVKCTMCDKLVKNKFALPKHIRTVHSGRRHQCVQCDKAFKNATQLKEHVACHTGESLYNCPYCDQKFKANANFFAHRRRKHFAEYVRDRDAGIERNFHATAPNGDDDKTENISEELY